MAGTTNYTNRSGTITSGGASQQLMPANTRRAYWFFQNISADTLWLDFAVAAVQDQPSVKVLAGESVSSDEVVTVDQINVIGPNTGAKFVAKEG